MTGGEGYGRSGGGLDEQVLKEERATAEERLRSGFFNCKMDNSCTEPYGEPELSVPLRTYIAPIHATVLYVCDYKKKLLRKHPNQPIPLLLDGKTGATRYWIPGNDLAMRVE